MENSCYMNRCVLKQKKKNIRVCVSDMQKAFWNVFCYLSTLQNMHVATLEVVLILRLLM